jgi:hypothetical protein
MVRMALYCMGNFGLLTRKGAGSQCIAHMQTQHTDPMVAPCNAQDGGTHGMCGRSWLVAMLFRHTTAYLGTPCQQPHIFSCSCARCASFCTCEAACQTINRLVVLMHVCCQCRGNGAGDQIGGQCSLNLLSLFSGLFNIPT